MIEKLPQLVIRPTYKEPCARRSVRNEFNKDIKKRFKQKVFEEYWLPCDARAWEVHHIVPVFFGGSNTFSNLCLVPAHYHKEIHAFIDAQRPDETNPLKLPYCPGECVWDTQTLRRYARR